MCFSVMCEMRTTCIMSRVGVTMNIGWSVLWDRVVAAAPIREEGMIDDSTQRP